MNKLMTAQEFVENSSWCPKCHNCGTIVTEPKR